MKNLIGMVDFVLEQKETSTLDMDHGDWYFKEQIKLDKIRNYAKFLKQPLELWMFVSCDEDGNALEGCNDICACECDKIKAFRKAKERCLFKIYSFEEECDDFWYFAINELTLTGIDKVGTIEDLVKYNLELTATAQKQIGL